MGLQIINNLLYTDQGKRAQAFRLTLIDWLESRGRTLPQIGGPLTLYRDGIDINIGMSPTNPLNKLLESLRRIRLTSSQPSIWNF